MQCGNCKKDHETVQEVKDCYSGAHHFTNEQMTIGEPGKRRGQYELIQDLLKERGLDLLPPYEEARKQYTKVQATEYIRHLIRDIPKIDPNARIDNVLSGGKSESKKGKRFWRELAEKFGSIPAGFYATDSLTGNNDTDFWEVDRVTEGNWAGCLFISQVVGGHSPFRVKGDRAQHALQEIMAVGIEAARFRFGQELGRCGKCGRDLTKYASRRLSIGPSCAEMQGLDALWHEVQSEWDAVKRRHPDAPDKKIDKFMDNKQMVREAVRQASSRPAPKRKPVARRPASVSRLTGVR